MTTSTAAWLAWLAMGVAYAQLVALGAAVLNVHDVAATNLGVAAGIGWAAITPRVLRWASRHVRARG